METETPRPQPAIRQPAPDRGAPATYSAQVTRKGVLVRVSVRAPGGESDEIREHGYGHGV